MPRLTNTDYLDRHHFLRLLWREYPQTFAVLKSHEQWQVHRYYQTQVDAPDDQLLAQRQALTTVQPALPHVASKAYRVLHASFEAADQLSAGNDLMFRQVIKRLARERHGKTDKVWVASVVRPEPDYHALARALLDLAKQLGEEDAA